VNYLPYVNILQGTQSSRRYSNGNTLPLVQLPFAMAAFSIQTDGKQEPWFFDPTSRSVEGIRLTHQPSPWIGDYGTFLFLPQSGIPESDLDRRWSDYSPEQSVLRPDYMRIYLRRSHTTLELTPTMRGCECIVEYTDDQPAYMSFFR
jgi:putative alpha-1,2-mannosidase